MVRPEGLWSIKNPVTQSEIETAIFRLVAQYLNHLRYCVIKDLKIMMLSIYEFGQNWRREGHNFSTFLDEIAVTHEL
jgi:hypothetical protein